MSFGQRLLSLRKQKGLSQDEMGSQLNVSRQTVSKWELGETTPDMDKLILISELFEISLDELIRGTPSVEKTDSKAPESVGPQPVKPKKGLYDIVLLLVKVFGVVLLIDAIVMVIYFVVHGFPE